MVTLTLTPFMSQASFYTPRKRQKIKSFLLFLRDIKKAIGIKLVNKLNRTGKLVNSEIILSHQKEEPFMTRVAKIVCDGFRFS